MAKQNVRLILYCKREGLKLPSGRELLRLFPLDEDD